MARRFRRSSLFISLAVAVFGMYSLTGQDAAQAENGACVPTRAGYRCTYGPFRVSEGANDLLGRVAAIPEEGFITGARVALVDGSGELVSGHHIHIHHAAWADPTTEPVLCTEWPGSLIYISGKERTKMRFPDGYGMYWSNSLPASAGPNQTMPYWILTGMLHGMHAGIDEEVYLRLNLRFEEMSADLTPVRTEFQAVVGGCDEEVTFDVARGSGRNGRYRKSVRFEWPRDGRFVWGTGHLHDGGISLALRNLTRDRRVMISRARYKDPSDPWYLTGTTTWASARGQRVRSGDVLRLRVTYDSRHRWNDVMGNLRITHAP